MIPAHLQILDAEGSRLVPLDKERVTVGRRADNDIQLPHQEVSREHAELACEEDRWVLRDRQSRYGTFVNGEAVAERVLRHGDRLRFGRQDEALAVFHLAHVAPPSSDSTVVTAELRQIAALLDGLRALGSGNVLEEVLSMVLDSTLEVSGAERGFIMLADAGGRLELKLARERGRVSLDGTGFETSRKIPEEVFQTGEPRLVADMLEGGAVEDHRMTIAHGIRTVFCLPLRLVRFTESSRPGEERPAEAGAARACIGVLYLDSRKRGSLLSQAMQSALQTLATEAAVAIENARLYRESAAKARIEEELRVAAQIQQALLPPRRRAGRAFEAAASSVSCQEVGGDFFDYLEIAGGKTGFVLGDVSGKGPPAALLAALVQGMFSARAESDERPAVTLQRVNHALVSRTDLARFATVAYAVLDGSGRLVCCNGGHLPPLVVSPGAAPRPLEAGGLILGVMKDAAYEEESVQLSPGDLLVLVSDGITEAENSAGEQFGDQRVLEVLGRVAGEPPDTVLDLLFAAVREFAGGTPQSDDMTAMVVRYGGSA